MNFQEFITYREKLLKSNSIIKNYSEMNLYRYYDRKEKWEFTKGHLGKNVHRCHLVEDWLTYYNLPYHFKKQIGVSTGVRNSLDIISSIFKEKTFLIPSDVYPYYIDLFNKKSIIYKTYNTINENLTFEKSHSDILLITDPLKPQGRDVSLEEIKNIKSWLNKDKNRLLIIDGVYSFTIRQDWINLFQETNQVILLFSLSKSWLLPNCFGISFLPNNQIGELLKEKYKSLIKDEEKLRMAYMALNEQKNIPIFLRKSLINKTDNLNNILNVNFFNNLENPSYLFYSNISFSTWLNKNILTIPTSVFGSKNDGSIISSLI